MRRERFDRINIVPFVDIVLVLLVIVLATATFVTHKGVAVRLPQASGRTVVVPPHAVTVTVDASGRYALEGQSLAWEALRTRIGRLDANGTVVLQADRQAPFGEVSRVLFLLQEHGHTQIMIRTDAPSKKGRSTLSGDGDS
jgi:biopolymer transport protein ExbD